MGPVVVKLDVMEPELDVRVSVEVIAAIWCVMKVNVMRAVVSVSPS